MRECEGEGARVRQRGRISLPRRRTLAFSSLAVLKRSKFQTRVELHVKTSRF